MGFSPDLPRCFKTKERGQRHLSQRSVSAPVLAVFKYQHTDALGSPIAVTDQNRNLLETSEYEPYGYLLNRPLQDGPGYTGHVSDAATGLSYMQQRYYDPKIGGGRFLSVDPVKATSVGGNFNRYWYANNNPYKFIDPDGRVVSLAGKPEDQQKFIDQTKQLSGTTVAPDKQGTLAIQSTNPKMGSPGAAAALANAIKNGVRDRYS